MFLFFEPERGRGSSLKEEGDYIEKIWYFAACIYSLGNVQVIEELYKKLLRRIGVSVNPEKWEKSLLKVCDYH